MPSATLQSRIAALESLSGNSVSSSSPSTSVPSKMPQIHSRAPLSPPLTPRHSTSVSPSPSPPNLGRKTSLIDLKDWVVDDGLSPPRTNGLSFANGNSSTNGRTPTQGTFDTKKQTIAPLINLESPPKLKPKPSNLSTKAPPLPPRKPSFTSLKSVASSSSLISHNGGPGLYSPHRSDSLTVDHIHTYPPVKMDPDARSRNTSGHVPASSISSFHSVSLSSDTDPSTPGSIANFIATFPVDQEQDRKLSTRSNESESDSISLGESYEEVSANPLASPVTERIISLDWENAMAKHKSIPPKLPQRPSSTLSQPTSFKGSLKSSLPQSYQRPLSTPVSPGFRASITSVSSSSTIANTNTSGTRRAPPPPPSRSSDRSSIQSITTSTSADSNYSQYTHLNNLNMRTRRPTPVPPAARKRYERVFKLNIVQQRKVEKQKMKEKPALLSPTEAKRTRQAAGWRGLSVDLITSGQHTSELGNADVQNDGDDDNDDAVDGTERLDGCIIKSIWARSRLDQGRLADIWDECDSNNTGTLHCDGFVKGMWRIDEELRRAQIQTLKTASTSSIGSFRERSKIKPPVSKPKPILR